MFKTTSVKQKNNACKQKLNSIKHIQQKLFGQIHTLQLQQSSKIKNDNMSNANSTMNWKYEPNNNIYMNRAAIASRDSARKNQKPFGFARLYTRGNFRNYQKKPQVILDNKQEIDEFQIVNNVHDPLAKLINKAKQITNQNQYKIHKVKKQIRKKKQGTFLTGTGLYQNQLQQTPYQPNYSADENLMLKQLIQTQQSDDLAELRRMIKMTDKRIKNYSNQVYFSSQNVINAGDHFKKHLDTGLLHKLNRIEIYEPENESGSDKNKKKYHSTNKNKTLKYG